MSAETSTTVSTRWADRETWKSRAACREADPGLFFFPDGERAERRAERLKKARKVCNACPVLTECGAWAQDRNERYGVWAGLDREAYRRPRNPGIGQVSDLGVTARWGELVDSTEVMSILDAWKKQGRSIGDMSAQAGLSESTLINLNSGRNTRVRARTHNAVIALNDLMNGCPND